MEDPPYHHPNLLSPSSDSLLDSCQNFGRANPFHFFFFYFNLNLPKVVIILVLNVVNYSNFFLSSYIVKVKLMNLSINMKSKRTSEVKPIKTLKSSREI